MPREEIEAILESYLKALYRSPLFRSIEDYEYCYSSTVQVLSLFSNELFTPHSPCLILFDVARRGGAYRTFDPDTHIHPFPFHRPLQNDKLCP
jgi:hypothetical protein